MKTMLIIIFIMSALGVAGMAHAECAAPAYTSHQACYETCKKFIWGIGSVTLLCSKGDTEENQGENCWVCKK